LLGRAQALVSPALAQAPNDAELLILRATLRQAAHDFTGALADLEAALTIRPGAPQALLTRAFLRATTGDYGGAEADCAALSPRIDPVVRAACRARVLSLTGRAQGAYALLSMAAVGAQPETRGWAALILADIAARLDRPEAAERHFTDAVSRSEEGHKARLAYARFLIETQAPQRALPLLDDAGDSDAALLTRALAKQAAGDAAPSDLIALEARFTAPNRRDRAGHLREEAEFRLSLSGDAEAALTLAEANWAIQKEPEDLRLLLRAALAANAPDRAADGLAWREKHQVEDPLADAAALALTSVLEAQQ
jgi:Tfp pilus assembly protein PilF